MVKKTKDIQYYEAIGRRKESVAQVRLYISGKNATIKGKKLNAGQILINEKEFTEVFPRLIEQKKCLLPLELTNNIDRFTISILVSGGGKNGQIEAIRHGLSRALTLVDTDSYKSTLRQHHLVTRDPRTKERRKVGTGGKARRQKQSPKR